ncbi:MAG: DNA replication/repair protein RecF [Oscillospiraceae bacterium]
MYITRLEVNGFKNLKNIDIKPHPRLNVFCGKNAQGKTNLVEAIWLCSGVKSFRNTKDKSMINVERDSMNIILDFTNNFRQQQICYKMSKQNLKDKNITLNGVKLKMPSKLFGNLNCVVFTPEDLELSKGSPENRRKFMDLSTSQIKKSYNSVINKYSLLLDQRNTLLKKISMGISKKDELEVWDIQLASMGAYISLIRYKYAHKLNLFTSRLYDEISGGTEKLELEYCSTVYKNIEKYEDYRGEMTDVYMQTLKDSLNDDLRMGFTSKGVHRDDLCGYINGFPSKEFASQGQHRSIALVMKLAQAYILKEEIDDAPCILLDDVLSELDLSRQKFVISKIHDMQVFITCCDKNIPFNKKTKGKLYFISEGKISENT